uniref:sporulation-specific protein 15-like n=1 Tax=Erigeron canadensis TaxID=72917 RepID=UPI001CB97DEB|nr:sporulation-specific protein 15-like [Erigeron canadensis]
METPEETKTKTMDNDDDNDEKKQQQQQLDSLKSLNAMLLKETVERRHQVDSLLHSNSLLESQLKTTASNTETAALLDIENQMLSVFINQLAQHTIGYLNNKVEDLNSRLHELVSKIDQDKLILAGVCVKRDEFKAQLDARILEVNQLELMIKQADEFKQQMLKQVDELKAKCDGLIDINKGLEERNETLEKEKSSVTKDLEVAIKELDQQKHTIVHLKTELENAKIKYDQAMIEMGEVLENLNKEKAITSGFKEKVAEMERQIQDLQGEISMMNTENVKQLGAKEELEDKCAKLVKKLDSLEAKLVEMQIKFDDTKGELCVAKANSKRVLEILKKTLLVCNDDSTDQENGVGEDIQEHFKEVEAIKRAFKDKESRIEEMKSHVELLKSEARKEKSFWTMVSSATTLLAAAVSVAYVARAH